MQWLWHHLTLEFSTLSFVEWLLLFLFVLFVCYLWYCRILLVWSLNRQWRRYRCCGAWEEWTRRRSRTHWSRTIYFKNSRITPHLNPDKSYRIVIILGHIVWVRNKTWEMSKTHISCRNFIAEEIRISGNNMKSFRFELYPGAMCLTNIFLCNLF